MTQRMIAIIVLATLGAGCSAGQEPTGREVENEASETMRRIRIGESIEETDSGQNPCSILQSGMIAEVFAVDSAAVEYRSGSTRHPLCTAAWRKPNADEIEAGQAAAVMDWMQRKTAATSKAESFDEPIPIARPEAETSLTIYNQKFATPAAAVSALEGIVDRLEEGVSAEVRGKEYTSQVSYEDWMPGVGDRAAWAPKLSQLSVAANGVIFHVAVRVGEATENQAKAVELARAIAKGL